MLLELSGIHKSFGTKKVLHDIRFQVEKGEIHGLVGKNGAGKTTLVQIIQGVINDYEGEVRFEGKNINSLPVLARQDIGIYVVPQHAAIIPEFTVAENIFLGIWPQKKKGWVDVEEMFRRADEALKEYKLDLPLERKVKHLSLVDQRKLNIVRALFSKAKLVILDEPTTSLSAEERESLFGFVKRQSENGTSFILISHYLEEILKICHTITVLRDGHCFTGYKSGEVNEETLSGLIVGEHITLHRRRDLGVRKHQDVALECKNICGHGLNGVSFRLHRGEIIGFIGFPGAGAREMCRALAGLNAIRSGEIVMGGKPMKPPASPKEALKEKIVYVSNDRHKEGIVPILSIKENTTLSILQSKLKTMFGIINGQKETEIAQNYFGKLKVKANSIGEIIGRLSGGNQQKVVISKALSADPEVLVLDEPTVGIDVQSREEILAIISELAESGLAVIYHTNDYNELLRISERLLFFHGGKMVREVPNAGYSSEDVIRMRDSAKAGEAS